jgi:hypothetical protein
MKPGPPARKRLEGETVNPLKPEAEIADDLAAPIDDPGASASGDEAAERKRSRTMSRKEMARDLRRRRLLGEVDPEEAELLKTIEQLRPRSRADCANGARPCLFVSCKHHLYLDVNPETGSVKLNFPDKEIWELAETCALDVADRGGITLEEVGGIMNLTRERIRQVETRGLLKLRAATDGKTVEELEAEEGL